MVLFLSAIILGCVSGPVADRNIQKSTDIFAKNVPFYVEGCTNVINKRIEYLKGMSEDTDSNERAISEEIKVLNELLEIGKEVSGYSKNINEWANSEGK